MIVQTLLDDDKAKYVLKDLMPELAGVKYALLGTLNLKIQGLPLEPRDIDFITNDEGIKTVAERFGSTIKKDEDYGYIETAFYFMSVEIHFVSAESNPLRPDNFLDNVVNIEKYGLTLPCLSLQSELSAYEKMNREKDKIKIELLRDILSKVN